MSMAQFRQLPKTASAPASVLQPSAAAQPPAMSPASALDLITEVATVLPALHARCNDFEKRITDARAQGQIDLDAANGTAQHWQRIAMAIRQETEQLIARTAELELRAVVAETDIATLEASDSRSRRATQEAETLNLLFQQKIVASFGDGSVGRLAMERMRAVTATR